MTLCQNAVQVRLLPFWRLCSTYRAALKTPPALAACFFTQGSWNPGSKTICLCRWTLQWLQLPPLGSTLPRRVIRLRDVLQHQSPTHIKHSMSFKSKPQIFLPLKPSYYCQRWRTGVTRSCHLLQVICCTGAYKALRCTHQPSHLVLLFADLQAAPLPCRI